MRSFRWCRQEVAEECWFEEDHVHICITTPEYRQITPRCGRATLNQRFYDLDPATVRRNGIKIDGAKTEEIASQCFTEAQAIEMVEFVKQTPEEKTIVVNCEAGISRSPGVVLAFRRFFGGNIPEIFEKAHPNAHVASVLGQVLRS